MAALLSSTTEGLSRRASRSAWRAQALAVGAAGAVVAASVVRGRHVRRDPRVEVDAAPFVGKWHLHAGPWLAVATAIAVAVVWFGAGLAATWPWRRVVAAGALASTAFTFALAASDGLAHVLDPVVHPTEYWANLSTLPPLGEMLRRYSSIDFLLRYSVHAKGHPPGFLVLLKGLVALGLGRPWVVGALSYLGAAGVVVAAATTVRLVCGEPAARAVVPFLVVAPYAVWVGTSADALFTAVAAAGIAAVVSSACAGRRGVRIVRATAGGAALGAALFLTYGVAVLLVVPAAAAVVLTWGRWRALGDVVVATSLGAGAVTGLFALAGFWWFAGAASTRTLYWWGSAQFRPAHYFAMANLAVAATAGGPAVVAGIARLRPARAWVLVGAALVCVAIADASQYSKAEVERIWLLFFPWLTVGTAGLARPRRWLALQALVAVGLQAGLRSKW